MDLPLLTSGTPSTKPWLDIVANSTSALYLNSAPNQETAGTIQITDTMVSVALPAGTGGDNFSYYNPTLNKVVFSGLSGANTAIASVNGGVTWTQLTTPFANPGIDYSPSLNLYSGVDTGGTAVYTSPSAADGSWVLGTPYAGPGTLNGTPIWFGGFSKFFLPTSDPSFGIASSVNGSVYLPSASNREVEDMDYAPPSSTLGTGSGRLVAVGSSGPQYTDDGKTWINSNSTASMAAVAWSSNWKMFFALPRLGALNTIFTSPNGIDWTVNPTAFDLVNNLREIVWTDELEVFVASGDNGVFWISKDGLNWRRLLFTPALASYGSAYIPNWGNFMSGGLGGNLALTNQRYLF